MRGSRLLFVVSAAAVVIIGASLRLTHLNDRVFHGDEAVNAFKFRLLWENGDYRYDPAEFHGPTLHYASLLVVPGHADSVEFLHTTEESFRLVTALFGIGVIVLTLCAGGMIGWPAAIIAALLTAISTAMVFYSRYYIHETPLVFFTLATMLCLWKWVREPNAAWSLSLGAMMALMHATKETAVLAWIAMGVGMLAMRVNLPHRRGLYCGICAFLSFAVVYVVFFSSFFTNWPGVIDGVRTFMLYLDRGTGGEPLHTHPWTFYFERLFFFMPYERGPWFSEALIGFLALVGIVAAWTRRGIDVKVLPFARFLALYTIVLTAAYTLIPYKTPWCVLSFLHGMILLAGIGATVLHRAFQPVWARALIVIALLGGGYHMVAQTCRANFVSHTHRANPWVYAHPVEAVRQLERAVNSFPPGIVERPKTSVRVVVDGNVWPIPFYLRWYEGVTYLNSPPVNEYAYFLVVESRFVSMIREHFGNRYRLLNYYGVRHDLTVALFVREDIWEKLPAKPHAHPGVAPPRDGD